ncbi:putative metabolite transport protein NicT [Paraburkholderia tropica]
MSRTLTGASPTDACATSAPPLDEQLVFQKVIRRLIPLLFLAYLFCHLDRLNIGFAQLQMKTDLGFSDAVYGLGAGLFFITYMACEVPSGLMLQRVGIRATLLRIMVGWGIVSAATSLVRTPMQFYIARLLLGACEAGFFPGIVYYISTWLPSAYRGRVIGVFLSATVLAGVLGGPLSGFLLHNMNGVAGLSGWQWLFLVEGLPSVLLGVFAFIYLDNRPADAKWLSEAERAMIERAVNADQLTRKRNHHSMGDVIRDPKVYLFAFIFFLTTMSAYGLNFWAPQLIRSFGVTNMLHIGLYAAIPSAAAFVSMIMLTRHSDAKMERRWHYAIPAFVGAAALALTTVPAISLVIALTALSVAYAGVFGVIPVFWAVPPAHLGAKAAAGGIAFINTLAVFSGLVAPLMIGLVRESTGSLSGGMLTLVACGFLAGITMLVGVRKTVV